MVQEAKITCVAKTDRREPHDRISALGGGHHPYWEISHQRAIDLLEHDHCRLYTCNRQGERLYLVVVTSLDGHKYVKTVADSVQPEHLLNLPECPPRQPGSSPSPAGRTRSGCERTAPGCG
jgi:hypothetical protein